ncbi:hypothetical protein [Luteimonas sp. e5]
MATKKKAAPAPARKSKTDALSIRIDPRMRYGLELLARLQRRSVTGVVEWIIECALRSETIMVHPDGDPVPIEMAIAQTWSPFPMERVANLGRYFPALLTYDESLYWHVIEHTTSFWDGNELSPLLTEHWEELTPLIEASAEDGFPSGLRDNEVAEAIGIPF